jgi:riboflavin kinase/FMN adenylyltransferase
MELVRDIDTLARRPRAVAIGTFDGVHIGHQRVIGSAVQAARERGLMSTAVTFEHHPLAVIAPHRQPRLLTSLALKAELIGDLGVDEVVVLPFDRAMAAMTPSHFCAYLAVELTPQLVVVGGNFTFGAGGAGTSADLTACGRVHGFAVEIVPLVLAGGRPISSSRIRELVQSGRLAEAREILGRPPRTVGTVVRGFERGRRLGFPTANVEAHTGTLFPGLGVYAARAQVDGRWYRAAVNVGHNPTFVHHGDELGVVYLEAYLLGFEGDIYGREIRLDFVEKIRDEVAFEYVDDLVAQMHADVRHVVALRDACFAEVGLGDGDQVAGQGPAR